MAIRLVHVKRHYRSKPGQRVKRAYRKRRKRGGRGYVKPKRL